eukprot:704535-Pleurochrysis_carterae.AAC.1
MDVVSFTFILISTEEKHEKLTQTAGAHDAYQCTRQQVAAGVGNHLHHEGIIQVGALCRGFAFKPFDLILLDARCLPPSV